ncbi:hypothetical protein ACQJBY_040138 [Aegilops geniculata]
MDLPMTASIPLPDELLEEIFLRLPTLDMLACASATCTSFCRVIKGRTFRRRFRVLHRPSLLGFMDAAGFQPAQAPHPSASLAATLGPCAADFSFVPTIVSSSSYILPEEEGPRWRPRDARDGRVLLDWISLQPRVVKNWSYSGKGSEVSILMDRRELVDFFDDGRRLAWTKRERSNAADFHLAICDPLSRRYVLLPTIPEDLAAQPQDRLWEFEPVLAPNTSDESEENHFKVICIARYLKKLVLFVIQSTTMQWYMVESLVLPSLDDMSYFDCVRGCFCWTQCWFWSDNLMVLDTCTLRFSVVNFFTGYHLQLRDTYPGFLRRRPNAVVVVREGAIEMFSLVGQHGSFALHHTSLQDSSHEWKLEKIVQLPGQYQEYSISTVGAAEGFLFFQGAPLGIEFQNVDCYSMDVKTYEITKIYTKMGNFFDRKRAIPYFSFPRLLSEPTI